MNQNNGMITKIWGPGLWIAFHSMTFGYPIEPTDSQKIEYRKYFENIANVLPCSYCRESYYKFITSGETKLTDDVFKSRDSLTYWGYLLHEQVNKKLNVTYGVTYQEVKDRYESYRAQCSVSNTNGCVVPLDYKKFSYQHYYFKDSQIIPSEIASSFVKMAKLRGFPNQLIELHDIIMKNISNLPKLKKTSIWRIRNEVTNDIIVEARLIGQSCVESEGEWKEYPSVTELGLIILFSTTMEKDLLDYCYEKWLKDPRNLS